MMKEKREGEREERVSEGEGRGGRIWLERRRRAGRRDASNN